MLPSFISSWGTSRNGERIGGEKEPILSHSKLLNKVSWGLGCWQGPGPDIRGIKDLGHFPQSTNNGELPVGN